MRAYPELYFARFVILGEGDSERFIIPRLAEKMGISLDPSFVPVVPLGGRFVNHFWRLLNDLGIPHATLLDLDLGRKHGGPKIIQNCFQNLKKIQNKFWASPQYQYTEVTPDTAYQLSHLDLLDERSTAWIEAFQENGIFFSYPIDLDFAMLRAFPNAYQVPKPGGSGPQDDSENVQKKKSRTLKKEGHPELYPSSYDSTFTWYPYLFLDGSKPETHLAAYSRIPDDSVDASAPAELKALIEYVKDKLNLSEGEA